MFRLLNMHAWGAQLLGLRSFKAAAVLLFGLLAYDVFWVFGSPRIIGDNVMLAVATSDVLSGPTRLLFPRFGGSVGEASSYPFSLLGAPLRSRSLLSEPPRHSCLVDSPNMLLCSRGACAAGSHIQEGPKMTATGTRMCILCICSCMCHSICPCYCQMAWRLACRPGRRGGPRAAGVPGAALRRVAGNGHARARGRRCTGYHGLADVRAGPPLHASGRIKSSMKALPIVDIDRQWAVTLRGIASATV